jgi:hypothetical protein
MGANRIGLPARKICGSCLAVAFAALLTPAPAEAGSIFMKNGYIIQGPIVEYSEGTDGSIVLGWPNGKLTIYRRFVEKIDLDPSEEKNLKAAVEAKGQEAPDEVVVKSSEEELPTKLVDLVDRIGLPRALVDGARPEARLDPGEEKTPKAPDAALPSDGKAPAPAAGGADEAVTAVAVVKPPEAPALGRRVTAPGWGFSLQPPGGWRQAETEGCVSWTGPVDGGFLPSMNVVSCPRGVLTWEEACRALREDQAAAVAEHQVIAEETFQFKGLKGYRLAARGKAGKDRLIEVHQMMVEKGDRVWILSTFSGEAPGQTLAQGLQQSLQTFQLEG